MQQLFERHRETVLYVLFGVLTSAVNLIVYFTATWVLRVNYLLSNLAAWTLTVLFAYVTNKLFVFQSRCESARALLAEFAAFVNGRIVSGLMDMLLMWILVGGFAFPDPIVKLLNSAVVVAMNFVISKLFVFGEKEKKTEP